MRNSEIRQNIIEIASYLFYQNGYNSTGINEIIAKSGIAKATLYNHFKSKEELCLAYLKYKNATFLSKIKVFCADRSEGNAKVLGIFDFLLSFFEDKDFNGCWCINTVSEIPKDNELIRKEIQLQKTSFIDFIADLIREHVEAVNVDNLESVGRQVYLLYESAVAESHLHQNSWPILEAKSMCSKILV